MKINKETGSTGNTDKSVTRYSFTLKQILLTATACILITGGLFIWKSHQVKSIKHAYRISESEQIEKINAQMEKMNRHFLNVVGKTYSWAVRNDFMKDNLDQVDNYANDLVKERNFLSVMVTNDRGIILSSTDKKFEGVDFRTINSPYYLNVDTPIVHAVNDSLAIFASPLMNYSGKVGTVIIRYRLRQPAFLKL